MFETSIHNDLRGGESMARESGQYGYSEKAKEAIIEPVYSRHCPSAHAAAHYCREGFGTQKSERQIHSTATPRSTERV